MTRWGTYGVLGLGLVLVGGALWSLRDMTEDSPPQAEPKVVQQAIPTKQVAKVIPPSFDIVRISPEGDTVIAGRASPGAQVAIFDGKTELGRAKADDRGEWVFLPDEPLPSGTRKLNLSIVKDGKIDPSQHSEADVVLVVPKQGSGKVMAVQLGKEGAPSRVLQRPSDLAAQSLSIAAVDYNAEGDLSVSGGAPAKAKIVVYVDNKAMGKADAADNGDWRVQTGSPLTPGKHAVRADHVRTDGKVISRVEVSFNVAAGEEAPKDVIVVVEPGNSLWRIARRIYGHGIAYTVIFEANRAQIRDPDLIYPGQQFIAPHKS